MTENVLFWSIILLSYVISWFMIRAIMHGKQLFYLLLTTFREQTIHFFIMNKCQLSWFEQQFTLSLLFSPLDFQHFYVESRNKLKRWVLGIMKVFWSLFLPHCFPVIVSYARTILELMILNEINQQRIHIWKSKVFNWLS
jgi:hypothetical protein